MDTQENGIMKGIQEFVGGGFKSEDAYIASKLYQKVQTSLYQLADKLNTCGNNENAQEVIELSESLKGIYGNIKFAELNCNSRKE